MWYFEIFDSVRRLLLTSVLVTIPSQSTRLAVALFVAGCSVVIQTACKIWKIEFQVLRKDQTVRRILKAGIWEGS